MHNELRMMIENTSVSDEEVTSAVLQLLKDRFDAQGAVVAPTDEELEKIEDMRNLVGTLRPAVLKEVETYIRSRFSRWELMKFTARVMKKKIL